MEGLFHLDLLFNLQIAEENTRRCIILGQESKLRVLAKKFKDKANENGYSHLKLPGNLINIKRISPEALQVIKRLNNAKYSAYLVGGCVRDLLLQKTPKDFDVVTDATPEQIKKIFSNSRIIGKRFVEGG